ncbi:MAG: SLC13 family permease [Planctomycetaceae bacterium]|nr:SLC13 family permease [Planctomycetaceae bacterium]
MSWEAYLALAVILGMLAALAVNAAGPDMLTVGSLTVILLVSSLSGTDRLLTVEQAFDGFSNPAVISVASLFIVVEGLERTGVMQRSTRALLGTPKSTRAALFRLMFPVAAISAFLNNTPVVAMFMPVTGDLCRRTGISPSRLFMPLSIASTLGGLCTLAGTSTNLVVSGLVARETSHGELHLFTPTWIGLPCCLTGLFFVIATQRWLLPNRLPAISVTDDPRQYSVEMQIPPGSPLSGQSIEEAGLRHLPGLFLIEIEREGRVMPAVGPEERLCAGDHLVFVGVVESLVHLRKARGLEPVLISQFRIDQPNQNRSLMEVVVSDRCPLLGTTIREGHFRTKYDAAVIAAARSGRRIGGRIGDIVLQAGDTLLLEARPSLAAELRNSPDFYLVSDVPNSMPVRHHRAGLAGTILVGLVVAVSAGILTMTVAALVAASLMILCRCCTATEARRSIDWSVLVVIGASLGLGKSLESSGAASAFAERMISLSGGQPHLVLAAIYLTTMLLTELITNNAAAVLVFPAALAAARTLGVNEMPYIMAVMVAASAGFATPIGYQTSLMVYGPGGYRFADYLRLGIPLDIVIMAVCVVLLPLIWPL